MTRTTTIWGNLSKDNPTGTTTDRRYWLRVFAGQMAHGWANNRGEWEDKEIAECIVKRAIALLDAIEDHEKEANQ